MMFVKYLIYIKIKIVPMIKKTIIMNSISVMTNLTDDDLWLSHASFSSIIDLKLLGFLSVSVESLKGSICFKISTSYLY